jgi:N-terminal domain of galactosyltransferase/Glycosyl transferase family 2
MIDGRRVSITTGCMNRTEFLRRALATWVQLREVDEILVVDWGSWPPLAKTLAFSDRRLRIVRVANRRYWENARCHNLEWRLATGDYILRLDSDCLVSKSFFARHPLVPGAFWAGDWSKVPAHIDDKRNLTGTLFVERQHLRRVNGYNERLVLYGKEDDDLYVRLEKSGLRRRTIDFSTMDHIPHSDEERYRNLRVATPPAERGPRSAEWIWHSGFQANDRKCAFLISISEAIRRHQPWTVEDRMSQWATRTLTVPAGRWPIPAVVCKELPAGQACKGRVWRTVE